MACAGQGTARGLVPVVQWAKGRAGQGRAGPHRTQHAARVSRDAGRDPLKGHYLDKSFAEDDRGRERTKKQNETIITPNPRHDPTPREKLVVGSLLSLRRLCDKLSR